MSWAEDWIEDRRRILAAFCAMLIAINLDAPTLTQVAAYALAWIIVGAIDDVCHQLVVIHGCVHDAADEAATRLLAEHERARRAS